MPRLTPVSWNYLVKRLRELGFEGPYAGGKHPQIRRGDLTVIIPNPHEGDISVGLLSRLLRQAGVSREEWLGG
ncbi:type II toxin-antitoxin system HicA family toxin [Sphaerospermopsis sp. LEGE 08334]|jgi:predicted RNA binding protein YcfA (HicA-like mRNA interferase family)|uniref:type II toxin-antitoxin system HicA family toxin n=1 Tax=Sphaerospermopsis sp. LEGE 08334 TaxID=1828651 RepID=UPI001880BBBC|nr:type II toxin-antitoxin system HicA family toxin [Sphaerospermopsis sp. LEGE 08334]MBE9057485.1 type II toxin-antitoxin system HicA family toxin [Sphaerospermopsis sp. LEGE 08334]